MNSSQHSGARAARLTLAIATSLAVTGLLGSCGGPKGPTPPPKLEKPAPEFVADLNKELVPLFREGNAAGWTQATYINVDTELLNARATERWLAAFSKAVDEAKAFDGQSMSATTKL